MKMTMKKMRARMTSRKPDRPYPLKPEAASFTITRISLIVLNSSSLYICIAPDNTELEEFLFGNFS